MGTAQIIEGSEMDRTSISTFLTGGSSTHLGSTIFAEL
jgi:hypothetical protein